MRNDYQGESFAGYRGRIPQRFAGNRECRRASESVSARYRHLIHRLFLLSGRNDGRIPQFDLERPIVERCFARSLIEVQDVYLIAMYEIDGADSYAVMPARGQLRGIPRRNAVIACYILLRQTNTR